jgi:ABC-type dipeptide/oligopeptide/nickel transport system permease component
MKKRVIYRIIFLTLTILVIPLVPIFIIFTGISSSEYVMKGTLNLDITQTQSLSYWEVYKSFLNNILRLDFGTSISSGQAAMRIVCSGLMESLKIIIPAILFSYLIATFIGAWTERDRKIDSIWNKFQFIFYIPMIVFSYLLLYFLSSIGINILSNIKYFGAMLVLSIYRVLPASVLALIL